MGILTSSRYPEEIQGQHTPMVTAEKFYRVQAILDGRNTNIGSPIARHNKENTEFPLRRIFRCKNCNTVLTGAWSKGRNARYAYYVCRKRCGTPSLRVEVAHNFLTTFMKDISLTDEALKLLISFLQTNYKKRIAILQKRKLSADAELAKLYAMRQTLVEKNLTDVYSDEIFKEQNAVIEEKIKDLQVTKDTSLLNKYTLEETVNFITEKFADLGKTYAESSLEEKKALLGSIFPSGIVWYYPGMSNRDISPLYQAIRDLTSDVIHVGDPSNPQFEPALAWLEKLRKIYKGD